MKAPDLSTNFHRPWALVEIEPGRATIAYFVAAEQKDLISAQVWSLTSGRWYRKRKSVPLDNVIVQLAAAPALGTIQDLAKTYYEGWTSGQVSRPSEQDN